MEHAAGVPEQRSRESWLGSLWKSVAAPVVVTVLGAALTAFIAPRVTAEWQNHEKAIELRSALATQMTESFARAVVDARFVAMGLIYAPPNERLDTVQGVWRDGLREWTISRSRIGAQLAARFPTSDIGRDWRQYAGAVTAYYRLSSQIPRAERYALIDSLRGYLGGRSVDWDALRRLSRFKDDRAFRTSYTALGERIVGRGDDLVGRVVTLDPVV